jgi:hypothetical protein
VRPLPLLSALAAVLLTACSAVAGTVEPVLPATPLASSVPHAFLTGLTVPWAVGGVRTERDGKTGYFAGEWPDYRVPAIRLWDTYTTWANLEPSPGEWRLWRLDGFVEKARARGTTDITLVLGGTPRWAASRIAAVDAPWIGPGSASPPTSMTAWREYVTTVATRYRGRITAYEIGNEPNLPMFWNGTPEEYAELVAVATAAVSAADPQALVVVNVGLVRRPGDVGRIATWAVPVAAVPGVDVLSVHAYPRVGRLAEAPALLASAAAAVRDLDPQGRPIWMTEINVTRGASLARSEQADAVGALTAQMEAAGFARAYWYSWTDLGAPGLIRFHTGTPADGAMRRELAVMGEPTGS